jgi:hypothetical protein
MLKKKINVVAMSANFGLHGIMDVSLQTHKLVEEFQVVRLMTPKYSSIDTIFKFDI